MPELNQQADLSKVIYPDDSSYELICLPSEAYWWFLGIFTKFEAIVEALSKRVWRMHTALCGVVAWR